VWVGVAAGVGAIAYLVWRQTQPLDDPWAEDEWDDTAEGWELDELLDDESELARDFGGRVSDAKDDLLEKAGDAAEVVGEAAGSAVKNVSETAKKVTRKVKGAVNETD
jgi:hypothetical protein